MHWLLILRCTHRPVCSLRRRAGLSLSLRLLCPLLAQSFGLNLLRRAWGRRSVQGARLEVHWRHKLAGILLLGDERVQFRLLWRPSLEWVDRQEAPDKVDERDAVIHLSINLRLLHVLPGHWIRLDDLRQRVRLEILLAGLLLGVVLPGILLHALQVICPPAKIILSLLEEITSLFAHLDHPVWWIAKHLNDSRNLVVLGGSWEQG